MAVAIRTSGRYRDGGDVALPAISANETVVIFLRSNNYLPVAPSGWTRHVALNVLTQQNAAVYTKFFAAAASAHTVSFGGSPGSEWQYLVLSGTTGAVVVDSQAHWPGSEVVNATVKSVTLAGPSGMLLVHTSYNTNTGNGATVPAGMTTHYAEIPPGYTQAQGGLYYEARAAAGATGAKTTKLVGDVASAWETISLGIEANQPPTAPAVTSPNGGETLNASHNITWTGGTDPEGAALTYDIELTTNNGGSWTRLYTGTSGTSKIHDFSAVAATTTARIRIRSVDSVGQTSAWDESNANFTIAHNVAGNAPTPTSPVGNVILDRSLVQRFTWTRNDPDVGDSQSKYDWRYRLIGAPSWTEVLGVVSTSLFRDVAAGTFAAGAYEWQVRTYDSQGVVDTAWSASAYFTAADAPAAPAITYPVNNGAIATELDVVSWSTPAQEGYQVRKVADNAGAPNTGTVYYDSGQLVSTAAATARNAPLSYPVNNRVEHIQVRIRNNGLWSAWSSIKVTVAYTPPATPIIDTVSEPATGSLNVLIVNPAPQGTQPAVTSNEVWVDDGDGAGLTRRATGVATNGSWRYWTPPSEKAITIQVKAIGANGVTSMTS